MSEGETSTASPFLKEANPVPEKTHPAVPPPGSPWDVWIKSHQKLMEMLKELNKEETGDKP